MKFKLAAMPYSLRLKVFGYFTVIKLKMVTSQLHFGLTWIAQLTSESETETPRKRVVCICMSFCHACESLMRNSHIRFLTTKLACLLVFPVVNHLSHTVRWYLVTIHYSRRYRKYKQHIGLKNRSKCVSACVCSCSWSYPKVNKWA